MSEYSPRADVLTAFGDPIAEYQHARTQTVLIDLSPRGKVELRGKDAVLFLHKLCTNDLKNLPAGAGCEAFLTTAKARVIAHFLASKLQAPEEMLRLDLADAAQAALLVKTLDRYLISEQVELSDVTTALAQLFLCGPGAPALAQQIFGEAAAALRPLQHLEQPLQIRRNDLLGVPGFDLFCPADAAAEWWQRLHDAGARPAGWQTYNTLRIEAGWPLFGADIDENRLVMELGRTPQAICYTKGCFLGQEPIVMARDRGHINRTLLGLCAASDNPLSPGSKVLHQGAEVAVVTSAVWSPRLQAQLALAYLPRQCQTLGQALEVQTPSGSVPARVSSLPFVTAPARQD